MPEPSVLFPASLDTSTSLLTAINLGSATLDGAINDSVITITLASVSGTWPSAGYITVDPQGTAEVIYYGSKSGNTLSSCIRGAGGTSAAAHLSGVTVRYSDVSAYHELIKDAVMACEDVIGITDSTDSDSHEYRITSLEAQILLTGAPVAATYLVTSSNPTLTNEVVVSALTASLTIAGNDAAARTITLGQSGSYTDLVNIGGTLQLAGTSITSSAAELNRLDGISINVTAANLNTLTGGSTTSLHSHSGAHTQNTDTGTDSDTFNVGDGTTAADKKIRANTGVADLPYLSYDTASNTWMVSNDGTTEAALSFAGHTHTSAAGWTDDGTVVRLTTITDNVGVGESNPLRKFVVRDDSASNESLLVLYNANTTDNYGATWSYRTDTTGVGATTFSEIIAMRGEITTHDHATRTGKVKHFIRTGSNLNDLFTIGSSEIVFNEDGIDANVRIEGDTDANLFFTDASSDQVIFGSSSASTTAKVEILGADNSTALTVKINATQANITAADTFIDFRSATGSEGGITGTGVAGVLAYNTFLGAHVTQIVGEQPQVGMVLEMTGDVLPEASLHLPKTRICKQVASKTVFGVYGGALSDEQSIAHAKGQKPPASEIQAVQTKQAAREQKREKLAAKRLAEYAKRVAARGGAQDEVDTLSAEERAKLMPALSDEERALSSPSHSFDSVSAAYRLHLCFGVGAGVILVSNRNGNIEHGDLLESDGKGYAQKQNDDVIRSRTIGKATMPAQWPRGESAPKLIGCALYCG